MTMEKSCEKVPENGRRPIVKAVNDFLDELRKLEMPLHSVLVMQNDTLLAECYSQQYQEKDVHRMYSATKSFVALAIGMLAEEGKISMDDPIAAYFPEKVHADTDPLLLETTIEDLLKMAPPFRDEDYNSLEGDVVETFFSMKAVYPSGCIFCYNSASPAVLTALVEKIVQTSLFEYLRSRLFEPMGFSAQTRCVQMPQGISWGASGLICTPRDLAKIGQLLLHGGVWEGKQLLPREFVSRAVGKRIDTDAENNRWECSFGYGYLIWKVRYNGFAFMGLGGQLLVCLPEKNLILVTTADMQAIPGASDVLIKAFYDTVYRCVQEDTCAGSIRPEEKVTRMLQLPLPISGEEAGMPEIYGKTITLQPNAMGICEMKFEKTENQILWSYQNRTGKHEIVMGMGEYCEQTFPERHYYTDVVCREGGRGLRCQACAGWAGNVLKARVYVTDVSLGTAKMTFCFQKNRVAVSMASYGEMLLEEYQGCTVGYFHPEEQA